MEFMEKLCIDFEQHNGRSGGTKARTDALEIARNADFTLVPLSDFAINLKVGYCSPLTELFNLEKLLEVKNSILLLQHPFPLYCFETLFKTITKHNKVILLSHDIEYIRFNFTEKRKQQYINIYNHCSCIISHNKKYTEAMRSGGVTVPIVELGMFDYLYPSPICNHSNDKYSASICFVGNLWKSYFLNQWINTKHSYSIDIIGPKGKKEINGYCNYIGSFPSEVVPKMISSNFGLIWDGSSLNTCDDGGNFGQYLRINNPHKFSLYIAAGIPVIAWNESGISDLIKEYGVGICIDSIYDLDNVMNNITQIQYKKLLQNVSALQKKVTNGYFLRNALNKSLELIS